VNECTIGALLGTEREDRAHATGPAGSRPSRVARHGQNGREIVLGRKNYRVVGSLAAADRYDDLYSALASCRLADVDPFAWLCDVLVRVLTHPVDRLIELAPRHWKLAE